MKLYTSPSCPVCRVLKEYLTTKGVEFEEIDITQNQEERESLEILTLPQLKAGTDTVISFNKIEVDKFIEKHGNIHNDTRS